MKKREVVLSIAERARRKKEKLINRAKRVYGENGKYKMTPERLKDLKESKTIVVPEVVFAVTSTSYVHGSDEKEAEGVVLKHLKKITVRDIQIIGVTEAI